MHRDVDYYEDVLQATEITYQARVAMKKGGMNANVRTDMVNSARKSRVRGIGLHRGQGASVFFFKSWRESMRQSRIPFLRASTFVILLGSAVTLGITMMVSADDGPLSPNIMLFICLVFSVYMQFFFGAAGSWSREIAKPTIYLVPERPFMKLVWACMDSFLQPAFDGIILFVVMGLMCQGPVSTVLTCMGLFFSYGVLFTALQCIKPAGDGFFQQARVVYDHHVTDGLAVGIAWRPGGYRSIVCSKLSIMGGRYGMYGSQFVRIRGSFGPLP